jgi:hypothetical protein
MPTGYTAELMEKGQDFRTFALRCARAFGACIMQRDDPVDAEPKKQEPSSYYANSLSEARAKLAMLEAMGPDARRHHGIGLKNEQIKSHREWLAKDREENARLDAMAAQVSAWMPPTEEHTGLKKFMQEQIQTSRHGITYIEKALAELEAKSPEEFYAEATAGAMWQIEYAEKLLREEQERTEGRNEWIEKLYASLPK